MTIYYSPTTTTGIHDTAGTVVELGNVITSPIQIGAIALKVGTIGWFTTTVIVTIFEQKVAFGVNV